jgi:hypothetical protein
MAYVHRAEDPESLQTIAGLLHDQWFHLPLARRDADDYVVPFVVEEPDETEVIERTRSGSEKRWRVPLYRAELRIGNVEDVRVDDRGQVETFMCVNVTCDESGRTIHVEAVEDADIYVTVGRMDVALSRSDELAAHDYRRRFLFVGQASGPPEPDPWPAEHAESPSDSTN